MTEEKRIRALPQLAFAMPAPTLLSVAVLALGCASRLRSPALVGDQGSPTPTGKGATRTGPGEGAEPTEGAGAASRSGDEPAKPVHSPPAVSSQKPPAPPPTAKATPPPDPHAQPKLPALPDGISHWRVRRRRETFATYYSDKLAGRHTANGEIYRPERATAAHRRLAFGTWVRVCRKRGRLCVYVRINDRGPFGHHKATIDLSRSAAKAIELPGSGPVRIEILQRPRKRR